MDTSEKESAQHKIARSPGLFVVGMALCCFASVIGLMVWTSHSTIQGNELAATQSLMTLVKSQGIYQHHYGPAFAPDFEHLLILSGKWMEINLGDGKNQGYLFRMEVDEDSWEAWAEPATWGKTGRYGYYIDPRGAVHFEKGQTAGANSPIYEMEE